MPNSRRSFLHATAATAVGFTGSVLGANDRIQGAIIGTGNRGGSMGRAMSLHTGTHIAAVCDVDRGRMEAFVKKLSLEDAELQGDWRRVIDRKDIDAVIITTPDHWHSPHHHRRTGSRQACIRREASFQHCGGCSKDAGGLH